MALSQAARDLRNKRRRERYRNDPEFREREKKRIELYWERQALKEAAALDNEVRQQATDNTDNRKDGEL